MYMFSLQLSGALFPWRYAVGVVIVVPVAAFTMLFFCPESPVWLLSQGREKEARSVLIKSCLVCTKILFQKCTVILKLN